MDAERLKDFLERKTKEYNRPSFIHDDPVSIPHAFSGKQDIEIAGLFAATFAWGNRTTIINKCLELMRLMGNRPYEFLLDHRPRDLRALEGFAHRTFNTTDLLYFIHFLQQHYRRNDSLETAFLFSTQNGEPEITGEPVEVYLNNFHRNFFRDPDAPLRTRKHVAAPFRNSACKRLNMYLRWMVRHDNQGVDFGIWKQIRMAQLICPLDLHVARVAKRFGLLDRPVADWLSAVQLTQRLRSFDASDPVKYDFALFALGVVERF